MKRPLLVLLAAGLLTWQSCSTATEKRYYQLHIAPVPAPTTETPAPGTALVRDARVDEIYSGYRLVYRYSPYQLDYYNYEYWIKKPARMLRECISGFLRSRNVFDRVIQEEGKKDPDWVVESRLLALEEVDKKEAWFAHLAMIIRILHGPDGPVVASRRFDRMDKLSRRDSRLLPRVISEILRSELTVLIREFQQRPAAPPTAPMES